MLTRQFSALVPAFDPRPGRPIVHAVRQRRRGQVARLHFNHLCHFSQSYLDHRSACASARITFAFLYQPHCTTKYLTIACSFSCGSCKYKVDSIVFILFSKHIGQLDESITTLFFTSRSFNPFLISSFTEFLSIMCITLSNCSGRFNLGHLRRLPTDSTIFRAIQRACAIGQCRYC